MRHPLRVHNLQADRRCGRCTTLRDDRRSMHLRRVNTASFVCRPGDPVVESVAVNGLNFTYC